MRLKILFLILLGTSFLVLGIAVRQRYYERFSAQDKAEEAASGLRAENGELAQTQSAIPD